MHVASICVAKHTSIVMFYIHEGMRKWFTVRAISSRRAQPHSIPIQGFPYRDEFESNKR